MNRLFKNTTYLIVIMFLVKTLSLVNRIIINRYLGSDELSLYVYSIPTIMLFMTLSSFSLQIIITKEVAQNKKTKNYDENEILTSSKTICFYSCLFTIIIMFLSSSFISKYLLKVEKVNILILLSITIIPFSSLNAIYRGYLNGINDIKGLSKARLFENIFRILFTFLIFFINKNSLINGCIICILSMTFGEIISYIYVKLKVKKYITYKNITNKKLTKHMLKLSTSETLTHLTSSFYLFLEPVIYTYVLTKQNISKEIITYNYSKVQAFALPLLMMFIIIPSCISTAVMPSICKSDNKKAKMLTEKSLVITILLTIPIAFLLLFYSNNYLFFLYNKSIGSDITSKYALFYIFIYQIPILLTVLKSYSKNKNIFIIELIISTFKLLLLFILSNVYKAEALIMSIVLVNLIHYIILYVYVYLILKINIFNKLFSFCILSILSYLLLYILKLYNIHYITSSLLYMCIYLIITYAFFIKDFRNE